MEAHTQYRKVKVKVNVWEESLINFFLNFLNLLNFMEQMQCNTVISSENRMLDLVLSNRNCSTEKAYNILVTEVNYHPAKITEMNVFYNFLKANFIGLYDCLCHVNWNFFDNIRDCDEGCEAFYQKTG